MVKNSKYNIGIVQIWIITFVWVLIFSMPLMFGDFKNGVNWNHILKIWTEYFFVFIIFSLNRFILLPKLFFKGKRSFYILSIIFVLLILIIVAYLFGTNELFLPHRIIPSPGDNPLSFLPPPEMQSEFIPPFANLFILAILLIGFDSGLIISVKWIQLEQNKLQLEKENIETKMAFLQNQVSPHFFMNTLNNIHALVDIDTDKAKDSIIKLSQMMGYMLYESQTERITIQTEIDFVRNYVELMKIRFTEDIQIKLNIPDELPAVSVPPFLTISFIENAFKYGISYEEYSFVTIDFQFIDNKMFFKIENTIHNKSSKTKNSGLGIINTKNRLHLIYGSSHELSIEQLPEKIFSVTLNLPI